MVISMRRWFWTLGFQIFLIGDPRGVKIVSLVYLVSNASVGHAGATSPGLFDDAGELRTCPLCEFSL